MATDGGAHATSSGPAAVGVVAQASGVASRDIVIPTVAAMRAAAAKAKSHKGKRARLYTELLAEGRQSDSAPVAAPRASRAEVLEKARAAKAAKRALTIATAEGSNAPASAVVLAADTLDIPSCNIEVGDMEAVQTGPASVFGITPLGKALAGLTPSGAIDPAVKRAVDLLCRTEAGTMTSLKVLAEQTQIPKDAMNTCLTRLGSALVTIDHYLHRKFVESAANSGLECVCFIETSSYDETPMEGRSQEKQMKVFAQTTAAGASGRFCRPEGDRPSEAGCDRD